MEVFEVKEFRKKYNITCEMDVFKFLMDLGLNNSLVAKVNVGNLFKYLNNNRIVAMATDVNGSTVVYITTGCDKDKSCLLTINYDFIKIEEARYKRTGNGTNQNGTVVTRMYTLKNEQIKEDSYAVSLSYDESKKARLTYFGDIKDFNHAYFTIPVTSKSLDGKGKEKRITKTLDDNLALSLLRIPYLAGNNIINSKRIIASEENIDLVMQHKFCL